MASTKHLRKGENFWYWLTLSLTLMSAISVFSIPDDFFPLIYVRYFFGTILVLWLPGYSLTKALFSKKFSFNNSSETLNFLERSILSVILSIILSSLVALFLNYTTWGIRLTSVVLSLSALVIILATFAFAKEHRSKG